jgi:ATP-binding cassette subfamily F protein uup
MDKVVDHLLVFKGDGVINDFPGNYTQYRWFSRNEEGGTRKENTPASEKSRSSEKVSSDTSHSSFLVPPSSKRKMTYKEKREFEQLELDIAALEAEKKRIEEALCGGTTSVEEITTMSKRLPILNDELDEKSLRWLELSEIETS